MRLGRFLNKDSRDIILAYVKDDALIQVDNFLNLTNTCEYPILDFEVLAPVMPKKIIAVGLNYKRHAEELKMKLPEEPIIFLKPSSSILACGNEIIYPEESRRVDYEAELGIVIAREGRYISEQNANDYILGYTAFNDVTARDLQSKDGQWTRAKSFDTFAPFGPYVETELKNPNDLKIQALLNGKLMQDSNTSDMIFSIPQIVSFISRVMTLYPGDIIATGTPEGIGPMQKGDEIIIRIEGLDDLINTVS